MSYSFGTVLICSVKDIPLLQIGRHDLLNEAASNVHHLTIKTDSSHRLNYSFAH